MYKRQVLELKKGADVEALKYLLYKKTKLEDTFGVNMLAVANGRPETLGLVPIIRPVSYTHLDVYKRQHVLRPYSQPSMRSME